MTATPSTTKSNSRRYVWLLAVPTTVLFVASAAFAVWLLFEASNWLDEASLDGERRLAASAVDSGVERLARTALDYSFWDEMYDQFEKSFDEQWAKDNLGPYMTGGFGFDAVIVADAQGHIAYGYSRDDGDKLTISTSGRSTLGAVARRALKVWNPNGGEAISGMLNLDGKRYMAGAGAISVSDSTRIAAGERPRLVLVFLETLDKSWVERLSKTFQLADTHVVPMKPGVTPLPDILSDTPKTGLVWTPATLGDRFLQQVLPLSLLTLSLATLVFVVATAAWTQIARRLGRAADEARAANAIKSEFLAMMSHEIRTPMNGVLGMVGILLEGGLNEDHRKHAEAIRDSGESLMRIINDVLDLSKLEAGKMEVEMATFDLPAVLHYAAEFCEPRATAKQIAFSVEIDRDVPQFVMSDAGRVRQVALNLLSNAIKFTQTGGVTLRASCKALDERQSMLRVEVSDTGIGIPADRMPLLFQTFTQTDPSISRRFGGTGLGLAICKKLVERMDGTIGAKSEDGKGSTFWFELPLTLASTEDIVKVNRHVSASEVEWANSVIRSLGRPLRRLLVEDNATNQLVAKSVLSKFNIIPDMAGNGLEAIAAVQRKDYDVVLMDMHMPEMDGLEATRAIRAMSGSKAKIPIIALTANAFESDVDDCLRAGMQGHVGKPFHRDELIAAIASVLSGVPRVSGRASAARDDRPIADIQALESFRAEHGEETFRLLIDTYLDEAAGRLSALSELFAGREFGEQAVRIAHSIKSSSAMAGAIALSQRAEQLEQTLRGRQIPPEGEASQMQDLFAAYRRELVRGGYVVAA